MHFSVCGEKFFEMEKISFVSGISVLSVESNQCWIAAKVDHDLW